MHFFAKTKGWIPKSAQFVSRDRFLKIILKKYLFLFKHVIFFQHISFPLFLEISFYKKLLL